MAYENDTCRVVGTLRWLSGSVAAGATVRIVQDAIRQVWDGAALPVVLHVTADGNGVIDFDLIPGHYCLVWHGATGQVRHGLWVPDAPLVWLADAAAGRESEWSPHFLFALRQPGHWSDTQDAI